MSSGTGLREIDSLQCNAIASYPINFVDAATTVTGTLATAFAAGQIVDGYTLLVDNLILLKNQGTASENGIYIVQAAGAPIRIDFLTTGTFAAGITAKIANGTVNKSTSWICTSAVGSDTVGTDNLTFTQYDVVGTLTPVRGGTGVTTFGGTNEILYTTAADTLASITSVINGILVTDGSGVPSVSTTLPTGLTIDSPILRLPQIDDLSNTDQYIIGVSELAADRTITLPALTGNDTFVFEAHTQTLTNKTLTSPIVNQITTDGTEEVLIFADAGAAVNEVTITNAATGTGPIISATGDDTDVDLSLQPKADGNVIIDLHTWPNVDGTTGQVLTTDGAGTIGYASVATKVEDMVTTTTATTTTISTLATASNTTYFIEASLVARRTDAGTESAGYTVKAAFRNDAGVLTRVGLDRMSLEDTNQWQVDLTVSGTDIILSVKGQAAKTINWKSCYTVITTI